MDKKAIGNEEINSTEQEITSSATPKKKTNTSSAVEEDDHITPKTTGKKKRRVSKKSSVKRRSVKKARVTASPHSKNVPSSTLDIPDCESCQVCLECAELIWLCPQHLRLNEQKQPLGSAQCVSCDRCGARVHASHFTKVPKYNQVWLCKTCTIQQKGSRLNWKQQQLEALHSWDVSPTISPEVKKLYSVIKKTGSLSGSGAGGEGMFGEITMGSFQRIVEFLTWYTDLGSESAFLDLGSGCGKPALHTAVGTGCR